MNETECIADSGCAWESQWDYCYELGCWSLNDTYCGDISHSNLSCTWKATEWGWCEEIGCWSLWTEEECNSTADNLSCVWDNTWTYCYEADCWQWDGNQSGCENSLDYSTLTCEYNDTTNLCDPPAASKGCHEFDSAEAKCMETEYCWYDYNHDTCEEPDSFNISINPGCWVFSGTSQNKCENVTGCTWNTTTTACSGLEDAGIQCENIRNTSMCANINVLSTCCVWRPGANCTTDYYSDACWDKMEPPPEGATCCEDYNAIGSMDLCLQISGDPWYMPCVWNNATSKCSFNFTAVVGGNGTYEDIGTKFLCKAACGTWITTDYCDCMGTANNYTDDKLKMMSWCEPPVGGAKKTCKTSCWACDYNQTNPWTSSQDASDSCTKSPANCEWVNDTNAPSSWGFCNFKAGTTTTGGCDKNCWACGQIEDDPQTSQPEAEIACKKSLANCTWVKDPENASKGYCEDESSKSCDQDCFSCMDQNTCEKYGLGTSGKCEWETEEKFCKPKNFNDEICFDGEDNDKNGMVDCDDPFCFFDPLCGGEEISAECWKYNKNETLCSAQADCIWITDSWGGSWCGLKAEVCWMYDNNYSACVDPAVTAGACRWGNDSMGGWCDFNQTKMESCFKYSKTACSGDCEWIEDPDDKTGKGGWCEYKLASCWSKTSQQDCDKYNTMETCVWVSDPFSPTGGRCEPKCFSLQKGVCDSDTDCAWKSGWCEPNMTKGEDCWMFDDNETTCNQQKMCKWQTGLGMMGGGLCDVNITTNCMQYQNTTVCGQHGECNWTQDPMGNQWCANAIFTLCFGYADQEHCDEDNSCSWMYWGDVGHCEPICMNMSKQTQAACEDAALNGVCFWRSGFCEPKMTAKMFMGMVEGPPMHIGEDTPEDNIAPDVDIIFLGIKDMPESMGMVIGVEGIGNSIICKDINIYDEGTGQIKKGNGTSTSKFYWYLDTDGLQTGGCESGDKNKEGFEFFVKYEAEMGNNTGFQKTEKIYKCVNAEWKDTTVKLSTWREKMCMDIQGAMVAISYEDLGKLEELYDPAAEIRIYAVTGNSTRSQNNPVDSVIGYVKPGTTDFMMEDCMGFSDMDGDGLLPSEDPDCKFMFQFGAMNFEDCFSEGDDDGDGLTNCDDPDCKYFAGCEDTGVNAADYNDSTAPTITWFEVNTFPDAAFIMYSTDEPANGTVLFYLNDSSCTQLNKTIRDIGIIDTNLNEFKDWHDGPLDNFDFNDEKLGYDLENGTTYYYKTKVCDPDNNCGTSACSSFTTKSGYDDCGKWGVKCKSTFEFQFNASANEEFLGDAMVKYDFGEGWEQQGGGCGGKGGVMKDYNDSGLKNFTMKIDNEDSAGWSMSFKGMSAAGGTINSDNTNLGEGVLANDANVEVSGSTESVTFVGMNTTEWVNFYSEFAPKHVEIITPGEQEALWHCDFNETTELPVNCRDETDDALSSTYVSDGDYTVWLIPIDPSTFSVFFGTEAAGDGNGDGVSVTGSGGGALSLAVSETVNLGNITAGSTATAIFTEEDLLGIQEIVITAKDALENVAITVKRETDKPVGVTTPDGTVYRYFTITVNNVVDENLTSATIKFKVNKTWFTDNSIDHDSVKLKRFKVDAWNTLSTTRTSGSVTLTGMVTAKDCGFLGLGCLWEAIANFFGGIAGAITGFLTATSADYVYYEATTPGFSVFVITGETAAVDACTPGAKQCVGDDLQQCNTAGTAWTTLETCQYGCDPTNLVCRTMPVGAICTPGAKQCVGDDLQQCSSDGKSWDTIETCTYGCDSVNLRCKTEEEAAVDYTLLIVVAVVVIVVLLVIGLVYFRGRGTS